MPLIDIPSGREYEMEAFLCAGNALKVLFDVLTTRYEASVQGIELDVDNEIEYEKACQHLLRTSLVFAQQAYEMHFRALVCSVSPFLLIPDQAQWIKKASAADVKFSELKSVSASELPSLASAVAKGYLDTRTIDFFGQLRELRNSLVHAAPQIEINRHHLLTQISHLFLKLGWRNCLAAYLSYEGKSHAAILFDPYLPINSSHRILVAARKQVGVEFADRTLLSFSSAADGYCPRCFDEYDPDYDEGFQKTCLSDAEKLTCGVCGSLSTMVSHPDGGTILTDTAYGQSVILVHLDGTLERLEPSDLVEILIRQPTRNE